jgi:hypothetical protein
MFDDGRVQASETFCFYGEAQATLKMRRFSKTGLIELFRSASFQDIHINSAELPAYGIIFQNIIPDVATAV